MAGVKVQTRMIRTRSPGAALVEEAERRDAEIIYLATDHAPPVGALARTDRDVSPEPSPVPSGDRDGTGQWRERAVGGCRISARPGRSPSGRGESRTMLLRHRPPSIDEKPVTVTKGFEHLGDEWIAVLRWLKASRVEFVLVGPVAEAVRGNVVATGPVAIVPAPYRRNFERLARTLTASHACLRMDTSLTGTDPETAPAKLTGEKLARGQRWTLRCGKYDLDIEARPDDVPSYQELLYEAGRYQLSADLSVEVASPEDIEHFEHLRRTGVPPEIRISRSS